LFNAGTTPSLVVLNPGKRKRFLVHGDSITSEAVSATLDKILGGDARFTNVAGNSLPEFSSRA